MGPVQVQGVSAGGRATEALLDAGGEARGLPQGPQEELLRVRPVPLQGCGLPAPGLPHLLSRDLQARVVRRLHEVSHLPIPLGHEGLPRLRLLQAEDEAVGGSVGGRQGLPPPLDLGGQGRHLLWVGSVHAPMGGPEGVDPVVVDALELHGAGGAPGGAAPPGTGGHWIPALGAPALGAPALGAPALGSIRGLSFWDAGGSLHSADPHQVIHHPSHERLQEGSGRRFGDRPVVREDQGPGGGRHGESEVGHPFPVVRSREGFPDRLALSLHQADSWEDPSPCNQGSGQAKGPGPERQVGAHHHSRSHDSLGGNPAQKVKGGASVQGDAWYLPGGQVGLGPGGRWLPQEGAGGEGPAGSGREPHDGRPGHPASDGGRADLSGLRIPGCRLPSAPAPPTPGPSSLAPSVPGLNGDAGAGQRLLQEAGRG